MKKVRLGIIGTGLIVRYEHLPALRQLEDRFRIVALCNRTSAKADALASELGAAPEVYTDHRRLLSRGDVDAVLNAVPIHLLSRITQDAISAGKHVLQEKPIAASVAEGRTAIELARKHRVVFMVGEDFRYRPEFRQVRRLVQEGVIGQPKLFRLNALDCMYPDEPWAQTPWRKEGTHDGGYLIDGGVHVIAGMRAMVGSKVKLVHGFTASFNPALLGGQDDTLLLHLAFENGVIGQLALGYGTVDRDAHRPKIYGEKGTLVLDAETRRVIELWPVGRDALAQEIPMDAVGNRFTAEWLDFYSAVTEGRTPRSTPEEALADLIILDAGRRSAATGTVVEL